MREYPDNHRRLFDGGDDLQGAATMRTVFDINSENALEQARPAHACRRFMRVVGETAKLLKQRNVVERFVTPVKDTVEFIRAPLLVGGRVRAQLRNRIDALSGTRQRRTDIMRL